MAAVSNADAVKKESAADGGQEKRNMESQSKKTEEKSSKSRRISDYSGQRQCTVLRPDLSWREFCCRCCGGIMLWTFT